MIMDDGETLIDIPVVEVEPLKRNVDGSATFRMFGGPFHNQKIRIYPDKNSIYGRVVWHHPQEGIIVYKLWPPQKGSREKWIYMFDPDDKSDLSETERGYEFDPQAIERWQAYLRYKREYEASVKREVVWEGEEDDEDFEV